MKKQRISIMTYLYGLSFWMIFVTWEGGLTVQSILPFLFLEIFFAFINNHELKFSLNKCAMLLGIWFIILTFSTLINSTIYIDSINIQNLIGYLSFGVVFLWYYLNTKNTKNEHEIDFIINNIVIISMILSIKTIVLSVGGQSGKIMFSNLIGTEFDENLISAFFSIASIISFIKILFYKNLTKYYKLFYAFGFIVTFIAIALTGSRASLISVVLGILTAIFLSIKRLGILKFLSIILICLGVGIGAINLMPDWIYQRYFVSDYMDNSNSTRIEIWENAISGIEDQPLLGYGTGTFTSLNDKYTSTAGYSTPAHETYLDILIYTGIIGFVIFIAFLYNIIMPALLTNKNRIWIPLVVDVLFISLIISATKSLFYWTTIILLTNIILSNKSKDGEMLNEKNQKSNC